MAASLVPWLAAPETKPRPGSGPASLGTTQAVEFKGVHEGGAGRDVITGRGGQMSP
jgi:hypothetical protein